MKFLVPVDFTSNSINAGDYAAELARATKASILFQHVITPFVDEDTYLTVDVATVAKEAKHQLDKLVQTAILEHSIDVQGLVTKGDVTDEILKLAGTKKIDIIIMGTHSVSPVMKFLFGSTTSDIISKTNAAVLAVPDDITFSPPRHIVFASDYENGDIESLRQLVALAKFFDAEINVVHVTKEYEEPGTELSIIEYFSDLVEKHISYPKIVCRVFKNDNVSRGIEIFSQTVGANMIALTNRKHGLLDKFLNTSVAKEFIYKGNLPLLVFPHNELESNNGF